MKKAGQKNDLQNRPKKWGLQKIHEKFDHNFKTELKMEPGRCTFKLTSNREPPHPPKILENKTTQEFPFKDLERHFLEEFRIE